MNAHYKGNANGLPGRRRTVHGAQRRWPSIVQEVFGFVKRNYPERSEGRLLLAKKGVRGKDGVLSSPTLREKLNRLKSVPGVAAGPVLKLCHNSKLQHEKGFYFERKQIP